MHLEPVNLPATPGKPYRVTKYQSWGGLELGSTHAGDYRQYWQANAISWLLHHIFRYGCNTWKVSRADIDNTAT